MAQQPEMMQLVFECLSTMFKHLVEHLVTMLPEVKRHSARTLIFTMNITRALDGTRRNPTHDPVLI